MGRDKSADGRCPQTPGAARPERRTALRRGRLPRLAAPAALLLLGAGCARRQSALAPTGTDAAALYTLFITLLIGAVVLWLAMNAMFFWASRRPAAELSERQAGRLLVYGGIVLPTLLVGGVLVWGLSLIPDQRSPGDGLQIAVTAEQWWWRVEYRPADGPPVTSANEIRLPAGQRTEFILNADAVIHSFWIPALGGKMDMFPGRETRMSLEPVTPGTYRGQCAEFCGASHAWMAFEAVVMAPEDFDAWLAAEAADATPPASAAAERGEDVFRREGCGACHTIRGTPATGQVGPDLTHVGARLSVGAGRLGPAPEDLARWIAHTDTLKPEVKMPPSPHLSEDALNDLTSYLKGLT